MNNSIFLNNQARIFTILSLADVRCKSEAIPYILFTNYTARNAVLTATHDTNTGTLARVLK